MQPRVQTQLHHGVAHTPRDAHGRRLCKYRASQSDIIYHRGVFVVCILMRIEVQSARPSCVRQTLHASDSQTRGLLQSARVTWIECEEAQLTGKSDLISLR